MDTPNTCIEYSVYHGHTMTSHGVNKPINKCLRHVVPSWRNAAWSSLTFVGCLRRLLIRLPNSSQRYSMGARSEERAVQSSTWIPLDWRKFWVRAALWARALSCCKRPRGRSTGSMWRRVVSPRPGPLSWKFRTKAAFAHHMRCLQIP